MFFGIPVPEPATLDLALIGLTCGLVVLLGVPAIKRGVRQPASCELEEIGEETLAPSQQRWFLQLDERMASIGFQPIATFRVSNSDSRNLNRAYASPADPALALATAIADPRDKVVQNASYVEFTTDFRDGSNVTSRGIRGSKLLPPPPHVETHDHPRAKDPVALKRRHDAHCEPHRVREAVFHRPDEFNAVFRRGWQRRMQHQIALRLLTAARDGYHRATTRLAIKAVLDFLNPFGGSFGLESLLAATAVGLILPMAAVFGLSHPAVGITAALASGLGVGMDTAQLLSLAPVLLLSGAALARVLEGNAVVWGLLLPYAGCCVVLGDDPGDAARGVFTAALVVGATLYSSAASLHACPEDPA